MPSERPELSRKNRYYISKYRYYELKYFCLQYDGWKRAYGLLDKNPDVGEIIFSKPLAEWRDYTGDLATLKTLLKTKMELVECAAKACDMELWHYIFMAVSNGWSYEYLLANFEIPCGRDMFYDRRRRFFWILSKTK